MKKIMITMMILAIAIAFMPTSTFAASGSTVKANAYKQVLKSGNTVYACGDAGIFKVTVKNGKAKKVKRLVKGDRYCALEHMQKKGNYIYYHVMTNGTPYYLYRANVNNGKTKRLVYANDLGPISYAVKGSKIYYKAQYGKKYRMNLNGKNKKRTSVKPKMKVKKTNAGGYRVINKEKNGYIYSYIKTPKGTKCLGKIVGW